MIEQKSLVELAGDEIKKLISSGALSAGDRILEQHLSVQLGISRPPLREALRILAAQHILEQSPRRGYHVAGLGDDDAAEIYSLRTVLESFALDLLFERLDRVDFTELEVAVDAMWAAARAGDQVGVIEANKDFHLILVGLSGHKRLAQTYQTLMEQMQLHMARNLTTEAASSGSLREGCRRHEDLLEALQSREPERIRRAMRAHGERRFLDGVKEVP